MPEVTHTDDSTQSLVDVDSPHISSVPSDFDQQSVRTDTQASRIEREEDAESARQEAAAAKDKAKAKGKRGAEKARGKADRAGARMRENPEQVVRVANAVTGAVAAAALGYAAYQKHLKGELSWKVVGLWGGLAAAFGVGDYYAGQYLLQRYQEKK